MKSMSYWPQLSVLACAALALGLAACQAAPAPGDAGPGSAGVAPPVERVRELPKYEDELLDLSNLVEPPATDPGGIAPEDLTATPKTGGVVRAAGIPQPMEPHFILGIGGCPQCRIYGSGVLRWDIRCGCPQPDLAESWTVSNDGLTYDFKLRKGVRWQNLPPVNGREVTVEDLKWSLERVSGLAHNPGRVPFFATRFAAVKEFQIVDDRTLRMVMKQRDVQILAEIQYDYMIVVPKEAAIDGAFAQVAAIIGTGPFMVDYGEVGGNWRLKRNPDFWEKDKAGRPLPYLDAIELFPALDDTGKVAAFKARQVDWVAVRYTFGKSLLGDPNVRYYTGRGLTSGFMGIAMNVSKPPFNDVRVRRALNLALDRQELLDTVWEGDSIVGPLGRRAGWHWSEEKLWSLPGYARGAAKQKEIEEAKRLLAEAGYGNGLTFEYWTEIGGIEIDTLKSQLRKVGMDFTAKVNLPLNRMAATTKQSGRAANYMQSGGGHTPDFGISTFWLCDAIQNTSLYCNPEIEKLYLEERRERETEKRMKIIDKMQQILWDDMPGAPISRLTFVQATYKNVRGWRNTWYDLYQSQGFQTAYMWLDK